MGQNNKNNVEVFQRDDINQNVDRLDSATHLIEGMFAQFKETPDQSNSSSYSELAKGDILLITKLHFADGELHSLTLKDHPRNANSQSETSSFKLMLDQFYLQFDVLTQEQGQIIRERELAALNARIEQKKQEYADLESNPEKLNALSLSIYSKRLASPLAPVVLGGVTNLVDLLGSQNAAEQIEHYSAGMGMAKDLLEIQLNYLQQISQEIMTLARKVMPYVMERMIVSISSMEERKVQFEKMNDSVASMQLYNGVSVDVHTIREGESADPSIPLTLTQERLFADVELSYFNATKAEKLDALEYNGSFLTELVSNDDLVNQIFPTQRCVCVMAIREKDIDYKALNDSMFALIMNQENKSSFLLIRDGENIHAVYSPIGSHLAANNLFPSKKALDRHFFTEGGDIKISPDSLDYVKAADDAEREVLHYKRFLILIAGLQHRLNLFGRFYPEKEVFNIFNIGFQQKYFNYIHDADGEGLITDGHTQSLQDWALHKNRSLHKGSMVICNNYAMTIYQTAAGCFRWSYNNSYKDNDGYRQIKAPVEHYSAVECQANKAGEFFVKIKCSNDSHQYYYDKKPHVVDCVYLLAEGSSALGYYESKIPYLVLDSVSLEELEYYCSQRRYRKEYLQYMGLFKAAIAYLKQAKENNLNDVDYYLNSVSYIQDSAYKPHEVRSMINDAISFFKGKNKQDSILSYLYYQLSNKDKAKLDPEKSVMKASKTLMNDGIFPIALMQSNTGNFFVYTNILAQEELNQITPHFWMNRYALVKKRSGFVLELVNEKVSLDDFRREERLIRIFNQDRYDHYHAHTSWSYMGINYSGGVKRITSELFHSYAKKQQMIDTANYSVELLQKIMHNAVDRKTVEFLHGLINSRTNRMGLYVGFKKGHPIVKLYINNGISWLKALYAKYQAHPELEIVNQDNSELTYYMESVNLFSNWELSENIMENESDETGSTKYSSRSIGYVFKDFLTNSRDKEELLYSPFEDYMDTLFGIDDFLGNPNIMQPVVQLGIIEGDFYASKKQEYVMLEHLNPILIAEISKLEAMNNLLSEKLEALKLKWDLQKNRVTVSTKISNKTVIHADDYKYLLTAHSNRNAHEEVVWSTEYECYMNSDALELFGQSNLNAGNNK